LSAAVLVVADTSQQARLAVVVLEDLLLVLALLVKLLTP
jgi:hypothetical protein